jgi:tetratricopeptide (TPR) repeat protein
LEISDSDLGPYRLKVDTEVTIGQGDTHLSQLFDKIVMSMKEGECCYVKCRVDVNGNKVDEFNIRGLENCPKLNVSLKSFSRAANIEDLECDELLEQAEQQKVRGVELYQAGNIVFSVRRFQRALDFLKQFDEPGAVKTVSSVADRIVVIKCQCELNLAACRLKTEEYESVIEHCNAALAVDQANVKGLYRRAQALAKLERHAEALKDLTLARKLEPNNRAVCDQLKAVEKLIIDEKNREKSLYTKMFA